MPGDEHPIFGDVRYNAVFFMIGTFCVGLAFILELVAALMPLAQGGPVAGLAREYALMITLAAGLGGVGCVALGLGTFVFAQNYEPIREEARLVAFAAIPFGVFLISIHLARVQLGGINDYFAYEVSRGASGVTNILVAVPETYGALGIYHVMGSFTFAVLTVALSYFFANLKIVKNVEGLTVLAMRFLGPIAFIGQLAMFAGYSAFAGDTSGTDWFGPAYVLYLVGYIITTFFAPAIGLIVVVRAGMIFWDAAKTVRYLSDFRRKGQALAALKSKDKKDDRQWWEKLAEEGTGKEP